ncbi:MAG: hypothetical protein H7Z43_05150 [Clostridia bacterium]|nr:hypothetical protein [Deltaproteobacteria bacterium]
MAVTVLVSDFDRMEGDLVSLERHDEFEELFAAFQKPELYRMTGIKKPPTRREFKEDVVDDETLVVWNIIPDGETKPIGYALFVSYDGPPYFQFYWFNGKMDLDIAADATLLMVHAFFKQTKHKRLHTFVPQPVDEEVHARLIEGGFDYVDEHPTVDVTQEGIYVMERYTYEAYHGGEEDEEERELDFEA